MSMQSGPWPEVPEETARVARAAFRKGGSLAIRIRDELGSWYEDGVEYEIDLNAEHTQALRDRLARYVNAARRAGGGARQPARGGRRASAGGVDSTEVREWAEAQGIDVKDRGRVPAELVVKLKAATET